MKTFRIAALTLVVGALLPVLPAAAQPLGSFRWQLQPYCNVVTLAVVQQGGQYQLDGTDDQCGAAQAAGVRGLAFQNPNGSIGFGLTIVTAPGGTPVHVDATIAFPGLNGTWRDSAGNTGNIVFGAGVPSVGPRPVSPSGLAPGSVTTVQIAPSAVTNAQIAPNAVTAANIADGSVRTEDLATPPAQVGQASTSASFSLSGMDQTIRSVTLTVPSNGTVVASATGMFQFPSAATVDGAWCSITTSTTVQSASYLVAEERSAAAISLMSVSGTRFFPVTPGSFTIRLVCLVYQGSATFYSPSLSALFIPG